MLLLRRFNFSIKLVHVSFEDCTTREYYAHVENIILEGISCGVLGVGPQA